MKPDFIIYTRMLEVLRGLLRIRFEMKFLSAKSLGYITKRFTAPVPDVCRPRVDHIFQSLFTNRTRMVASYVPMELAPEPPK